MLKSILEFKGVEVLSREEQKKVIGSGYQTGCTRPCGIILPTDSPYYGCVEEGCDTPTAPGTGENPTIID